jgi:hypothetical protein
MMSPASLTNVVETIRVAVVPVFLLIQRFLTGVAE